MAAVFSVCATYTPTGSDVIDYVTYGFSDIPALTPAEVGTRLSDPGGRDAGLS